MSKTHSLIFRTKKAGKSARRKNFSRQFKRFCSGSVYAIGGVLIDGPTYFSLTKCQD